MQVTQGAIIKIWCEGTKTLMSIDDPNNSDIYGYVHSLTILADTSNGMTCNLSIEVV